MFAGRWSVCFPWIDRLHLCSILMRLISAMKMEDGENSLCLLFAGLCVFLD
jgi:hypothetical protein